MRYDKKVYFATVKRTYDEATGDYVDTPTKVMRRASVLDTSRETMQEVYGGFKKGTLTIHLQNHYKGPYEYIEFEGTRYKADKERKLRFKHTLIVSEVQRGR